MALMRHDLLKVNFALWGGGSTHYVGMRVVNPETGTSSNKAFKVCDLGLVLGALRAVEGKHAAARVSAKGGVHQVVVKGNHVTGLGFQRHGRDFMLGNAPKIL
jgi:hypothetical protein